MCHINEDDNDFHHAASEDSFDIRLVSQPPKLPDFNFLDLGFFNAIQSLQHKEAPKTTDDLIMAVEKSFLDFTTS